MDQGANPNLVDRIDALLPQTQCTRCGFPGCQPYAQAIADGAADINRCPPGGQATLTALAVLLARDAPALDESCGTPGPLRVARIDAALCIGCVLCIDACPVDAIVGAPRRLHGVLPSLCTGCELCVAPCPVDCITMEPALREWTPRDAGAARERSDARRKRLAQGPRAAADRTAADQQRKRQAAVTAALARARARRSAWKSPAT